VIKPAALLLALGVVIAAILARLTHDTALFRYATLGGFVWLVALAVALRRTGLVNIVVMVAVLVAMVGLLDVAALVLRAPPGGGLVQTILPAGYRVYLRDAELGYAPAPGDIEDVAETADARIIYQVRYSIGADGLRITPGSSAAGGDSAVFLGDSVTFGDGVNDSETLAAQFAAARPGWRVSNAALSGYGTHQMLRALETGRVTGLLGDGARVIVYSAITDHLVRLQGLRPWDLFGPHYILRDGQPVYQGPFHSAAGGLALRFAGRSALFDLVHDIVTARQISAAMTDPTLFGAMVQRARDLARDRYHAKFVVLLWDVPAPGEADDQASSAAMADELLRRGVAFRRISEIVPDIRQRGDDYQLPLDHHPTALLNQTLARALASGEF
jgi:hypothetical protein